MPAHRHQGPDLAFLGVQTSHHDDDWVPSQLLWLTRGSSATQRQNLGLPELYTVHCDVSDYSLVTHETDRIPLVGQAFARLPNRSSISTARLPHAYTTTSTEVFAFGLVRCLRGENIRNSQRRALQVCIHLKGRPGHSRRYRPNVMPLA